MGTPEFAVPTLNALAEAPAYDVVGVVTQPDRRCGRGRQLAPSAVKEAALAHSLPVFQPPSLREADAVAQLRAWEPLVCVVAAFGQILQPEILDLPSHGCINVHASLLPRWRGAAPVTGAILEGDQVTGVTIMRMDAGLDTGPILSQSDPPVPIHATDTREELTRRLAREGAELLLKTLPPYLAGELTPQPQPEEGVTYVDQLRKQDGQLDWSLSAIELDRRVRAFQPWPGTFTTYLGQRLKVLRVSPMPEWRGESPPGTLVALADGLAVATGRGALRLEELQLAGKRSMDAEAFLCGQRDCVGNLLGESE